MQRSLGDFGYVQPVDYNQLALQLVRLVDVDG